MPQRFHHEANERVRQSFEYFNVIRARSIHYSRTAASNESRTTRERISPEASMKIAGKLSAAAKVA
jgi:hypothetical protein